MTLKLDAGRLDEHTLYRIFHFICQHNKAFGYSPSMREIAESCFIARPTVYRYLDRLEALGYIVREPGRARAIMLLHGCEQFVPLSEVR
jgi:DNA-binding MarR family transcriptional regulator